MRKLLVAFLLLPMALFSAPPTTVVSEVIKALNDYNPYKVDIQVVYGNTSILGFYEVDNDEYYISIDQQELYGNASQKCEVFNGRKEIIIDLVQPDYNGSLLSNPATAFDSILKYYSADVTSNNKGVTIVELKPINDTASQDETIVLSVSNDTKLPSRVIYSFGDEQVTINILSISKLTSDIASFDYGKYPDYEVIDFR